MTDDRPRVLVERLVHLNARFDSVHCRAVLSGLVFVAALATYLVHTQLRHTLTGPPSVTGDSVEYDSLAWELAQGRGYQIDLSNPEFRRPYLDDPDTSPTAANWPQQAYGPTAKRPPLYVLLMAAGNRLFGRQFWFPRTANSVFLAATCALVAWTVARLAGPLPALIAAFQFVVIDWRTRYYGREVLTEALSMLLVAVLAILLMRMALKPRLRLALAAGGVCGLALLARSMFVLWLPGFLLMLMFFSGNRQDRRFPTALLRGGVFLLTASLVAAPWWVRNCRVLGRFEPFGTQGRMELSAGYSDAAFRRGGMWLNMADEGLFDDVISTSTGLQREQAIAEASSQRAKNWAENHPLKLPLLAAGKVFHELRPHGSGDLYVLAFAVLGLLALRGAPDDRVLFGLVLTGLFAVALTWSTSGRFIVPLLYPMHVAAAIGAWTALLSVTLDRRRAQDRLRIRTDDGRESDG